MLIKKLNLYKVPLHMGLMGKVMVDQRTFLKNELDLFISGYVTYEEVRPILGNVTRKQMPELKTATRQGINKGLEEFLIEHGSTLFDAEVLRIFIDVDDNPVEREVFEKVNSMKTLFEYPRDYAKFIKESVGTIFYQDSLPKYIKNR